MEISCLFVDRSINRFRLCFGEISTLSVVRKSMFSMSEQFLLTLKQGRFCLFFNGKQNMWQITINHLIPPFLMIPFRVFFFPSSRRRFTNNPRLVYSRVNQHRYGRYDHLVHWFTFKTPKKWFSVANCHQRVNAHVRSFDSHFLANPFGTPKS